MQIFGSIKNEEIQEALQSTAFGQLLCQKSVSSPLLFSNQTDLNNTLMKL